GVGEGHAGVGVAAVGVLVHGHQPAGIGVDRGGIGKERGRVAVGAEAEVHDVEAAGGGHPLLVGVGPLVAAHGVDGVGRPPPLQERLPHQALVGVGVMGGYAALVAP